MCETCGCQGNVVSAAADNASVSAVNASVNPAVSASVVETPPAPPPFLERFSDGLQQVVKVSVGANRKPPRLFKSLLSGTTLGHPLHPVLTDIPIGAWTIAAILDIIWLISPTANVWASRSAF